MSEDAMSEEVMNIESKASGDGFADAMAAVSLIAIALVTVIYWISNQ